MAASATTSRLTVPQPRGPSRNKAASVAGMSTAAVRMRMPSIRRLDRRRVRRGSANLLTGSPEAAFTLLIGSDRGIKRLGVKIGPQQVGEIEFGIGKLPEQKVRDALLAAGSDKEIGFWRVGHRQI